MTPKEGLLSPTDIYFNYFMMSMWPWISLERESCWIWSLRKISSQCHNNPILVPTHKPPDTVKDIYDGQTYELRKGWIYGQGWMWFQWSIKNLFRHFT